MLSPLRLGRPPPERAVALPLSTISTDRLTAVQDGVKDPVKAHSILGAPRDPAPEPAYRRALAVFRQAPLGPEALEEGDVDALVSQIEDEVRARQDVVGGQH